VFALLVVAFICLAPQAIYANDMFVVTVNGEAVQFPDQLPLVVNDTTLVPVGSVFSALGFAPEWDSAQRIATLRNDGYEITIGIGSEYFSVNGVEFASTAPAQIIGSRAMAPLNPILSAIGMEPENTGCGEIGCVISIFTTQQVAVVGSPPFTLGFIGMGEVPPIHEYTYEEETNYEEAIAYVETVAYEVAEIYEESEEYEEAEIYEETEEYEETEIHEVVEEYGEATEYEEAAAYEEEEEYEPAANHTWQEHTGLSIYQYQRQLSLLLNDARYTAGLPRTFWDGEFSVIAQDWAEAMVNRRYTTTDVFWSDYITRHSLYELNFFVAANALNIWFSEAVPPSTTPEEIVEILFASARDRNIVLWEFATDWGVGIYFCEETQFGGIVIVVAAAFLQ